MDSATISSIISAIHSSFYTGCVFLLSSKTNIEIELKISEIRKILNTLNVMTASAIMDISKNIKMECTNRKPLIAFHDHNVITTLKYVKNLASSLWLTFENHNSSINQFLREIYIPFNCEFFIASDCNVGRICIKEVYQIAKGLTLQEKHLATWNRSYGLQYNSRGIYVRRNSLKGLIISAATNLVKNAPYTTLSNNTAGEVTINGIFGQLWHALEHHLQFRSVFSTPTDRAWGILLSNGSWNGMIAMILRRQAEVAVAQFTMTSQRMEVIEFLSQLSQGRYCIFLKNPGSDINVWGSYWTPFSNQLWMFLIITFIIITVSLWIVGSVKFENGCSFSNSFFTVLIAMLQQSDSSHKISMLYRIILYLPYIVAVVIFAAYSASIISSLAVRTIQLPFETFDELASDRTYQIGIRQYSPELSYLKETKIKSLHVIYEKIMSNAKLNINPGVDIESICTRKDKFAYMTTDFLAEEAINKVKCEIIILPKACIKTSLSMVVKRNSPYRGILMYNLNLMQHSGILKRAHMKTFVDNTNSGEWITVSFRNIVPLIVILTAGIVVSCINLVLEIVYLKIKINKQQNYH